MAFTITFRTRDPETVARVANALAAFYVEENAKIPVRQAGAARLTRLVLASYHIASRNDQLASFFSRGAP